MLEIINNLLATNLTAEQQTLVNQLKELAATSSSSDWNIHDFLSLNEEYKAEGFEISENEAKDALQDMYNNFDATQGISWDDVDEYYQRHCHRIENPTLI